MLVSARVKSHLTDGITLSFCALVEGSVNRYHLGAVSNADAFSITSAFPEARRVQARVLYADPAMRLVALTLREPLVRLERSTFPDEVRVARAAAGAARQ